MKERTNEDDAAMEMLGILIAEWVVLLVLVVALVGALVAGGAL